MVLDKLRKIFKIYLTEDFIMNCLHIGIFIIAVFLAWK